MDHTDKSGMRVKGNLAVLGENKVFYAGAHVGRKRSTCLTRGTALRWLMWWQDGHLYEEFLEAETGWKVCAHCPWLHTPIQHGHKLTALWTYYD